MLEGLVLKTKSNNLGMNHEPSFSYYSSRIITKKYEFVENIWSLHNLTIYGHVNGIAMDGIYIVFCPNK